MTETAQASKLEPAYSVVRKFDREGRAGSFVLAEKLGIGRSAVTKWTLAKGKSGTGGFIPAHYYSRIMSIARELEISLTPAELTGLQEFDEPKQARKLPRKASACPTGQSDLALPLLRAAE